MLFALSREARILREARRDKRSSHSRDTVLADIDSGIDAG